jgi:hypothetical protein
MTIWVDAQLSPSLAQWITETLGVSASAVRELGLRDAKDLEIFQAAREANAVASGFNPEGGTRNFGFSTRASHSPLHGALAIAKGRSRLPATNSRTCRCTATG